MGRYDIIKQWTLRNAKKPFSVCPTNGCNVSLACVNSKECLVVSLLYFDKLFAHEDYNTSTYLSCDLQIVEDIILDLNNESGKENEL